jgi:aldose 1-epimerase
MSSSGRGQVLIRWPNRLQDGCYEFDGRRHQLPLNEPEHRNAIHGLVRGANWTTAEREPYRAVMEHILHSRR